MLNHTSWKFGLRAVTYIEAFNDRKSLAHDLYEVVRPHYSYQPLMASVDPRSGRGVARVSVVTVVDVELRLFSRFLNMTHPMTPATS